MATDSQLSWHIKSSAEAQSGQRGPAGPPGPPGPITTYIHTQVSPQATWLIQHDLGRFPSVTVVDSAGTVVIGRVQYLSEQAVEITFSAPFAGRAYLN